LFVEQGPGILSIEWADMVLVEGSSHLMSHVTKSCCDEDPIPQVFLAGISNWDTKHMTPCFTLQGFYPNSTTCIHNATNLVAIGGSIATWTIIGCDT